MANIPLSPREVERVVVFGYAESFPIVPEPGIIAVIVNPANGEVVRYAQSIEPAIEAIRQRGCIAYALADAESDPYWTQPRAQRLYDHHRGNYVNGD